AKSCRTERRIDYHPQDCAQHPNVLGHSSSIRTWTNAVFLRHARSVQVHVEQSGRKRTQGRTSQPAWNFWNQLCGANTNFGKCNKPTECGGRHIGQYGDTVCCHLLQTFSIFIREAELSDTGIQYESTGGQT